MEDKIFKIAKDSKAGKIGGAIKAEFEKNENLILRCIGPGSAWQGLKGLAISGFSGFPKINQIDINEQKVFCIDIRVIKTLIKEEKKEIITEEKK